MNADAELLGTEMTLYIDDVKHATTIMNNVGDYATGMKLNNPEVYNRVYNENQFFTGKTSILGDDFLTYYTPFPFTEGDTKAMLFMGFNVSLLTSIQQIIISVTLPFLIFVCVLMFLVCIFLLRFYVIKPLSFAAIAVHGLIEDS